MSKSAFIEQHSNAELSFRNYYKYSFTYQGEIDGKQVLVTFGGDPDDIYRADLSASETLKALSDEFDLEITVDGVSL
ncbi:hypothetical protein [Serratia sp. Se-RSBMAAmG]|uniref:hypothetical protein n=1 Tax=Serratia sp. Se-RSBMAAmG TaxID=3043305 RepID=UPI0024AF655B|nr:hypothetical protein [Serratia sp. Se-RSBMAAmG]MDI6977192.1 hypothetical protein [Serratia sp. Se-RSBMAAmG]